MFERFTEKAINVVSEAQRFARELGIAEVCPELLFLALVTEARGVSLKLFRMYKLSAENVQPEVLKYVRTTSKTMDTVPFSHSVKDVLKRVKDGTLSRVIKSNSNNHNEYATVSFQSHFSPFSSVFQY